MIVLRRPGLAEISGADAYIFRPVRQAAGRRETAPWTFHVAGQMEYVRLPSTKVPPLAIIVTGL
jgi:hypothetical protein